MSVYEPSIVVRGRGHVLTLSVNWVLINQHYHTDEVMEFGVLAFESEIQRMKGYVVDEYQEPLRAPA